MQAGAGNKRIVDSCTTASRFFVSVNECLINTRICMNTYSTDIINPRSRSATRTVRGTASDTASGLTPPLGLASG